MLVSTRWTPTQMQIDYLETEYAGNHYPTQEHRTTIAHSIGIDPRQVQVWFQNRRQKAKKNAHAAKDAEALIAIAGKGRSPSPDRTQKPDSPASVVPQAETRAEAMPPPPPRPPTASVMEMPNLSQDWRIGIAILRMQMQVQEQMRNAQLHSAPQDADVTRRAASLEAHRIVLESLKGVQRPTSPFAGARLSSPIVKPARQHLRGIAMTRREISMDALDVLSVGF